jgi:uncharacterized membrane protein
MEPVRTLSPSRVVDAGPAVRCPACGGANAAEAVFCANPACRKALGEFRFVREELAARARWHERLADRVSAFVGKPHFLLVHALWFGLWVAGNTGVLAVVAHFDEYPFSLLGLILAIEAIFITGFLLISSNRQAAHAEARAELDYEVNVRSYRKLRDVEVVLRDLVARLEKLERVR